MCAQTNREIWGVPFPVGGEWDAGYIRLQGGLTSGLVFVRRTEAAFEVVRREYRLDGVGVNRVVKVFPTEGDPEDAERQAKCFALAYRDRGG